MKININYDFIDKIKDVKEPFHPFKIVRSHSGLWATTLLPVFTLINMATYETSLQVLIHLIEEFSLLTFYEYFTVKAMFGDIFAKDAKNDLTKLALQLNNLSVNTNFLLLLESQIYKKEYKFFIGDDKIPSVLESKYIMVPIYNNGDIKRISLVQEHELGTKTYVLSLGSPMKQTKLAYAGA